MKKKKILIIDDEKDFTEMIKLNLEDTGEYEVKAEDKGVNALRAAKSFKPDLILLDIIIKDMDGGAIRHQLKTDKATKDMPIVFLTATVDASKVPPEDNVIGGYTFLAKPISTERLIEAIKSKIG